MPVSAMNYTYLLYVLLPISYFTETHSSAKLHNETKAQKKEGKSLKGTQIISKNDEDNTKNRFLRSFLFKRQKQPRPSTESSFRRVRKITKRPTTTTQCKIFCRSGYHLQILPSGVVRGTVDQRSKYVLFEMQSFGPSLVRLMSPATGRYLAMRRDGTLRGLRSQTTRDSLFKETHEQNAFHSYASHRYYRKQPHDMLVGIKRNGQIKRATKTFHGQTATQFLVIKF
ncbi:fibroblast growth factor 1-like [Stylophora pistillata]|uniref:fibroblast growth factor 1-like n=1 Tax=Stylophora pistillata TaxID=50429 RepID=UPI000C0510E1|nr:fibroblast growth factor 1-like [Stylophora pistillata]